MCILTGMRIGEVGALYSSDIYDGAIHVERTITKTESGSYVIGDDPKTWNGKRTIPLNDKIIEVIEHQKKINRILDGDKVVGFQETGAADDDEIELSMTITNESEDKKLKLVEVNEENWIDFAGLSVDESQKHFLASNIGIMARGYIFRSSSAKVIGIVNDGKAVGLALVRDMDEEPACYDLQQFMIDKDYQGNGYGTQALKMILANLEKEHKYDCVEVCVKKYAAVALHVYEVAGFSDTGYIDDDNPDSLNLMYYFN